MPVGGLFPHLYRGTGTSVRTMADMVTFFPVLMLLIQNKKNQQMNLKKFSGEFFFSSRKKWGLWVSVTVCFSFYLTPFPRNQAQLAFSFFWYLGIRSRWGDSNRVSLKAGVKCIYNVVPAWFQTEFRPLHDERGSPAAAVFLSVGSRGSAAAEYAGSRTSSTRPTIGVAFFATLSQAVCTTASMMSRCAECACASSPLSQLANGLVAPVETHQAVHGARLARSRPWQ